MAEGIRIERSIVVAAEAKRLWTIATDPSLSPRWNPNIVEVTDVSGLPIGPGSTWTQVVRILGRPVALKARVIRCDPPVSGAVDFSGPTELRVTTTISPEDGRCRLTQTMELYSAGAFGGMAMRLARPTIERELGEALERQKSAAESEA